MFADRRNHSAPDSVEHSLVIEAPLAFDVAQPYLELRAKLELLPGATLWADDRPIGKQTRAAQALQVRDASGEVAIVFDRVRAFEQQSPDHEVTGDYAVYATDDPATWMIGVRTPRAWWADGRGVSRRARSDDAGEAQHGLRRRHGLGGQCRRSDGLHGWRHHPGAAHVSERSQAAGGL
jgi:hypothetical protein